MFNTYNILAERFLFDDIIFDYICSMEFYIEDYIDVDVCHNIYNILSDLTLLNETPIIYNMVEISGEVHLPGAINMNISISHRIKVINSNHLNNTIQNYIK